ncbi:hypothetical protein EIN_062750 [Entamoeba invadens IP1]|uniref:hypothetical protein n=1 Tax=Entamoeba invadens IP1 TaxID=370355 RepID=UPI0002C3F6B5|nr:hypothetical protein EIN_062750 [Entamoeba invadens IP1]ELP93580.1 hypothetical protein EIN_062750 [Entamoeba invadens IP1]|eukprot:XP_004260351.1 hypothetical protein EIN_062750 [Entamoeba invadens IP1]
MESPDFAQLRREKNIKVLSNAFPSIQKSFIEKAYDKNHENYVQTLDVLINYFDTSDLAAEDLVLSPDSSCPQKETKAKDIQQTSIPSNKNKIHKKRIVQNGYSTGDVKEISIKGVVITRSEKKSTLSNKEKKLKKKKGISIVQKLMRSIKTTFNTSKHNENTQQSHLKENNKHNTSDDAEDSEKHSISADDEKLNQNVLKTSQSKFLNAAQKAPNALSEEKSEKLETQVQNAMKGACSTKAPQNTKSEKAPSTKMSRNSSISISSVYTSDFNSPSGKECVGALDTTMPKLTKMNDQIEISVFSKQETSSEEVLKRIVLSAKSVNNSIEVTYHVPQSFMKMSSWIGLYDKYEMDTRRTLDYKFCEGKADGFIKFDKQKYGWYAVRLFLNSSKGDEYIPIKSSDVCVGPDVKLLASTKLENSRKVVQMIVSGLTKKYWLAIYRDSEAPYSNDEYLIKSDKLNRPNIDLDVTALKKGKYECRVFCKQSCYGKMKVRWHSCGAAQFEC